MFLHEVLRVKQPDVFWMLLQAFGLKEEDLQEPPQEMDWFDAKYEMVHDSEGRYLDYTARGKKV